MCGKEVFCGRVLQKCVCGRDAFFGRQGRTMLSRSVVEKCWEVLERHVGEVCRREVFLGCCREVSETSV